MFKNNGQVKLVIAVLVLKRSLFKFDCLIKNLNMVLCPKYEVYNLNEKCTC